jgi:hypothetical protein
MEITLNDILTWLKTKENFINGFINIEAANKKKFIEDAFKSIFYKASKRWENNSSEKLEKVYETLSYIQNRIIQLEQELYADWDYYENNCFEALPPHPWEVFPPANGKPEIIKQAIEKDHKRDLLIIEEIKQNKQVILNNIHNCLQLIQSWKIDILKYSDKLRNIINNSHFESEPEANLKITTNTNCCLQSVDTTISSGLPNLLRGLKRMDLIAADTELIDFRRIFGFGGNVEKKIIWKNIGALRHFLIELVRKGKIKEFPARKKHIIASQLFEIQGKPNFDFRKLSSNNGECAQLTELKDLISNL